MELPVPKADMLPFSTDEYQARLSQLLALMDRAELDALLVTTSVNIYYLTGYQNSGQDQFQCLIVPRQGDLYFVLRKLYFTAVAGLSWAKAGVGVGDTEFVLDATQAALATLTVRGARIGYDHLSLGLPPTLIEGLKDRFSDRTFVPAGGLVEGCRRVKSEAELGYIRRACGISVHGLEAAVAELQAGSNENDLMAASYDAMVRAGSEYISHEPIVVAGTRSPARRTVTEGRTIQTGESVWYEASAHVHRYGGPIMRTLTLGPPHPDVQRVHDVMRGALEALLEAAGPGISSGAVDAAARSRVEAAGLGQFWLHRAGYSVGASFPPNWGEGEVMDLKPGDPRVLQPGMVFHTVCWLLIPELGSIGLSETWAVTQNGIDVLTDSPRELRVRQ